MKLLLIACGVMWRELSYFASISPHSIDYCFLPQGLHVDPRDLRQKVRAAISEASVKDYDAVLLGYGLCSGGLSGVEAGNMKLVIPKAHDCITLLLGDREKHARFTSERPEVYWYSPGWIETGTQPGLERLEKARAFYEEKYGKENGQYLMETMESWIVNYKTAAYVDLGVGERESDIEFTKKCALELGWSFLRVQGDPSLVRDLVNGDWDEQRFLVVEPGRAIFESYDSSILKSRSYSPPGNKKEGTLKSDPITPDDERFMREAIAEAKKAGDKGEVPIGAVIVSGPDIVGRGHNLRETENDPTAHAEIVALKKAAERLQSWRVSPAACYVTAEPCPMCAGALVNARVDRLVYGCPDPKAGACETLYRIPHDPRLNHKMEVVSGALGEECALLLRDFFKKLRQD